jgi:hypothetical protein
MRKTIETAEPRLLKVAKKCCVAAFSIATVLMIWGILARHLSLMVHGWLCVLLTLAVVGLVRSTMWGRFVACSALIGGCIVWFVAVTPMPSEHEPSILEPFFGAFLPTWIYVASIVIGIGTLLLPVWIFSKHREYFRNAVW